MSQNLAHNIEEKPRTNDILLKENFNFNSLLLSNTILQGLKDAGFYKPSPIQLKAIPLGRCGLDLIVQAKSGTGKTAVFTIIALEMIKVTNKNALQVLVFAPTREIAVQIEDVIKTIGKEVQGLHVGCFIGGLPIEDDIKKLKQCHIAVGAPGRLKHLVEKGKLKTDSVRLLVLDEADKLMEQCFQNDINYVFHKLPTHKQMLALSATYPDNLKKFLENYMQSPSFVTPEIETPILLGLRQYITTVKSHINTTQQLNIKTKELIRLLSKISFTQCLIFFNSQLRAEGISNTLNKEGWSTTYISGAQSQVKRLKVVNSLKKFECRILMSTDLTARGIDAANVDLVINYDVPFETATYLHRMGRAGRYGSRGLCITITAQGNELKNLQNILGEIGGTQLSIAKLPWSNEELVHDVWECDLNLLEKVYGTTDDSLNEVDVTNSVPSSKLLSTSATDTDVMSSDLEKLSVDENKNENSNQVGFENDSEMEICNIKNVLKNKQKMEEEINQQFAEVSAESLLESLAKGKSFIGKGEDEKKEDDEMGKIFLDNREDEEKREVLINPASLYPWVPVEGSSVLSQPLEGENLLEGVEADENCEAEIRDNRKRKRKQYKKQTPQLDCNLEKSLKNSVLLKNVALYNISKLLLNTDESIFNSEEEFDNISGSIKNYLEFCEGSSQACINEMVKHFEPYSCDDMLKNIVQYSEQYRAWSAEPTDPTENIFTFSYNFMTKNAGHWIDALGDKYEPVEEELEVTEGIEWEVEEEEEEEEEQDKEMYGNARQLRKSRFEGNYSYDYNYQEEVPDDDQLNNVNSQYSYYSMYAPHFDYYSQMLGNDALTFQDVPSFKKYFAQWQMQIHSVRKYVQQNVYVQEMNNYQYKRGRYYNY